MAPPPKMANTGVDIKETGLNKFWDAWDPHTKSFKEEIVSFVPSSGRQAYAADTEDSYLPATPVSSSIQIQGSFTQEIEKAQTEIQEQKSSLEMEKKLLLRIIGRDLDIENVKKMAEAYRDWEKDKNFDPNAFGAKLSELGFGVKDLRNTLLGQAYLALAVTESMVQKNLPEGSFGSEGSKGVLRRERKTIEFLQRRSSKIFASIQTRTLNVKNLEERISKIRESYSRAAKVAEKEGRTIRIEDTGLRNSLSYEFKERNGEKTTAPWAGRTAFGSDGKQYGPHIPYHHIKLGSKRISQISFQLETSRQLAKKLDNLPTRLVEENRRLEELNRRLEGEGDKRIRLQERLEVVQATLSAKPKDRAARREEVQLKGRLAQLDRSTTADQQETQEMKVANLSYSSPERIKEAILSIERAAPRYEKLLEEVGDPTKVNQARAHARQRMEGATIPIEPEEAKAHQSLLWEAKLGLDRESSRSLQGQSEEAVAVHNEAIARLKMSIAFLEAEVKMLNKNIDRLKANRNRLETRQDIAQGAHDIYEKKHKGKKAPSISDIKALEVKQDKVKTKEFPRSVDLTAVGDVQGRTNEAISTVTKAEGALSRYQRYLERLAPVKQRYLELVRSVGSATVKIAPEQARRVVDSFKALLGAAERQYLAIPTPFRKEIRQKDRPAGLSANIRSDFNISSPEVNGYLDLRNKLAPLVYRYEKYQAKIDEIKKNHPGIEANLLYQEVVKAGSSARAVFEVATKAFGKYDAEAIKKINQLREQKGLGKLTKEKDLFCEWRNSKLWLADWWYLARIRAEQKAEVNLRYSASPQQALEQLRVKFNSLPESERIKLILLNLAPDHPLSVSESAKKEVMGNKRPLYETTEVEYTVGYPALKSLK